MQPFFRNLFNPKGAKVVQALLFFLFFYLYLWRSIQPNLIYHGGGQITNFPIFYTDSYFFKDTVLHPGGLIEYLSAFLSQFLILSWAGSIVLTAHAFLVCLFTRFILKKAGALWYNFLSFVPATFLLITYNSYTYHFTATLALLAALAFSAFYIKYESDKKIPNFLLFLFLFILLYLIAAGLSLYFALLCVLYQLLIKRRYTIGLAGCAAAILSGLILTRFVFNLRLDSLYYSKLLIFSSRALHYPDRRFAWATSLIYFLLPLLISVFGIWRMFFEKSFLAFINKIKEKWKLHKAKKAKRWEAQAAFRAGLSRWSIRIG